MDMDFSAGLGGKAGDGSPPDGGEGSEAAGAADDVVSDGADGPEEGPGQEGGEGSEAAGADEVPDYGPGRETKYRRETWPAYAYPPRKKIRIPMAAVFAVAGVVAGALLSMVLFMGIRAVQERMMYQDVVQVIRAQWPNRDLLIRPGFHDDIVNAPYYGTEAWEGMSPSANDDGSFTLEASTSREFAALILAMREYMDALILEYESDESFLGFGTAKVSLDYDTVTVTTPMHQSGLIDQDRVVTLLRQMKIHNILYRAISGEEPEVKLVFVNGSDTVLTMRM